MASRQCSVCAHKDRAKIEALVVGGMSQTRVAETFEIDRSQLCRHMSSHVTAAEKSAFLCGTAEVVKLRELAARENGSILEDLCLIRSMCFRQLHGAASVKDANKFAQLAGKFLEIIEALGRRTGEIQRLNPAINIDARTQISVTGSPEFARLQRGLMRLCIAHPEVRSDVAAMLRECEGEEKRGELPEPETSRDAA